MAHHRPEIYRELINCTADRSITILRGKGGLLTLAAPDPSGQSVSLSRGNDPIFSTVEILSEIKTAWTAGQPIALRGLGDGYVLSALAASPPALLLGRQQAVFVIESDARLVMAALMLHDYSGPQGPIRQHRFRWFIGPDWGAQFEKEFFSDPFLPFPLAQVGQGPNSNAIEPILRQIGAKLVEFDQRLADEARDIYSRIDAETFADLFSDQPSRPPRILLLTSRFTTVLQYSTRDAAEGFTSLGWQTRVLIEPSAHQSRMKQAMLREIVEFKPDLVFVIDHLRHEYEGILPDGLPFVCWIQDHLPNLCNPEVGSKIGLRDFILTGMGTRFIGDYHYPAHQIVDLPNLARIPQRPAAWVSDGLDLAYTSNWSKSTEEVVDDILSYASSPPQLRAIAQTACARILAVYERGESLATQLAIRQQIELAQHDCGLAIAEPRLVDTVVNLFWDRLNNHLYRHQALIWVADLAQRRGLKFGLFGRGWERHPVLSKYAMGFVKPGPELEEMVRRTKINLQIEPFACFTHPRLLSGLFAGGFFLVRDHPFNVLPSRLLNFLADHAGQAETMAQALVAVSPDKREELQSLLHACREMGEQADIVQMTRNWHRSGLIVPHAPALANLPDVTFTDPVTLQQKVERFLADANLRGCIGDSQRRDLQGRLSYSAGLNRACRRIEQLLRSERGSTRSN